MSDRIPLERLQQTYLCLKAMQNAWADQQPIAGEIKAALEIVWLEVRIQDYKTEWATWLETRPEEEDL